MITVSYLLDFCNVYCEIRASYSGAASSSVLGACDAVSLGVWFLTFWRSKAPLSSRVKQSKKTKWWPWRRRHYLYSRHGKKLTQWHPVTSQKTWNLKMDAAADCHLTRLKQESLMCDKHNLSKISLFVPVKVQIKTVMDGSSLVNILTAVHYSVCVCVCVSPHDCACNLKKIALWGATWFVCVIKYY